MNFIGTIPEYKSLAMPMQISDDAGVRDLAYNSFNELDTEEQCKLSFFVHPCLWLITWDPTQPVATRPLAIQKDGTWYTYGWDLTKNICEIFGQNGYIRSTYAYTPFGSVTASGDVEQPIQWSSEHYDNELALVYYNYRHYNPTDGRWINRDPIAEQGGWNLYEFVYSYVSHYMDYVGMGTISSKATILFSPKTIIPYIDMLDIYMGSHVRIHPDDGVVKCCLKKINKRHCSIVCNYMINATMVIDIDEAVVNDKFSVEKLIGIFGHEQKHLKNIIEYIKEESNFVNNINVPDNLSNTDIGRVKEIEKMLNDRFLKWMIDEIKHLHGVKNKTDYAPMENSIFIEKIKGKRIVNPKNFTWPKPTITKITKKDEIPCP